MDLSFIDRWLERNWLANLLLFVLGLEIVVLGQWLIPAWIYQ